MPAVQLNQLKKQIEPITWQFTQPEQFVKALKELMEYYSGRIFRPGTSVQQTRQFLAYHIPPLLLQQLEISLAPLCGENPNAALLLADQLWQEPHLEMRRLAAFLLNQVPVNPPEPITQRLKQWCQASAPQQIVSIVLEQGTQRILHENPQALFAVIDDWLSSTNQIEQVLGINALLPFARDKSFDNMPLIFKRLSPLLQDLPSERQKEMRAILDALAKRTPIETTYFLRQVLTLGVSKTTVRLIRKLLPSLPTTEQQKLQQALKEQFG